MSAEFHDQYDRRLRAPLAGLRATVGRQKSRLSDQSVRQKFEPLRDNSPLAYSLAGGRHDAAGSVIRARERTNNLNGIVRTCTVHRP